MNTLSLDFQFHSLIFAFRLAILKPNLNKPLHMKLFVHQQFSPSQGLALLPRVKKMFPFQSENENVLIDKFSSITNVDAGSINKTALISKLYRYKTKLKGKRESAKVEFEKETFSLPVATMQAPVKGKIVDDRR
jgi:hypothetical protein